MVGTTGSKQGFTSSMLSVQTTAQPTWVAILHRAMIPDSWKWRVGLSLSLEAGYQKLQYSPDDWTLEIRPIIDKTWKKFYVAFNPVFDKSLHGQNENKGFDFSPNLKVSYNITKVIAAGFEYYGSVGKLNMLDPFQQQQHQLFFAIDLDSSPIGSSMPATVLDLQTPQTMTFLR